MTSSGGIVFLGSSLLGAKCCEALLELDLPVAKIVSIPREFWISWANEAVVNAQFADLSRLAKDRSIPFSYITGARPGDYRNALDGLRPELLVVVGWYYHIPQSIRISARLGAVGIHASLLPKYRGGAPLVWAMIKGEKQTGTTLFHLSSGIDDGDVVAQSSFEISDTDDIQAVLDKAAQGSVTLVRENILAILDGTAHRAPQDEREATVMAQRTPADGLIRWEALDSRQAYDWIRAQTTPYPGAYSFLGGTRITIWAARLDRSARQPLEPGTLEVRDGLTVWCADGSSLVIVEASIDDEERVTAVELTARHAIRSGTRLGIALERA